VFLTDISSVSHELLEAPGATAEAYLDDFGVERDHELGIDPGDR